MVGGSWQGGGAVAGEDKTGRFLGLPYDWRRPTPERLKKGIWDPGNRRVFVPKVYGWGYGINLHALARRLRLVRPPRSEA
jgi:hypothetical protein